MLAVARGDQAAFEALFDRWAHPLVAFATRFVGRRDLAEELVQDIFVRLYQARQRYAPTAPFKAFLFRIARNRCLNELRRPEHRVRHESLQADGPTVDARRPTELPDRGPDPLQRAVGAEQLRRLADALATLPETQRAAVLMVRHQRLSYEETAAALRITLPALKSLLYRATRSLAGKIHAEEPS